MGNDTRLKPCPFCGSDKLKVDSVSRYSRIRGYEYTFSVRCNKCHARGGTAKGGWIEAEERAIENWNFRQIEMDMQMEDSE